MENKLRITLLQTDLVWQEPLTNRKILENKIKKINSEVDLIILPEMFTTGFTMDAKSNSQTMEGESVSWLKQMATQCNTAICGSLIIEEKQNYYNRLVFVYPDATLSYYDKRHTFTLAGEDKVYSAGTKKLVLEFKGWKICPLICYDLRFPVWSRNTENWDILIYVANWPDQRILAWDALLRARAIENMSYTIGVNRTGKDENNLKYPGHSAIYDPLGKTLAYSEKEEVLITTIAKTSLNQYRNKYNFLNDRDNFSLTT